MVAPPPVLIKPILSATPASWTAAARSPPPITVVALEAATARATSRVPAANVGNLVDAERAVPDDGSGAGAVGGDALHGVRAGVDHHPSVGDRLPRHDLRRRAGRGLFDDDGVDREAEVGAPRRRGFRAGGARSPPGPPPPATSRCSRRARGRRCRPSRRRPRARRRDRADGRARRPWSRSSSRRRSRPPALCGLSMTPPSISSSRAISLPATAGSRCATPSVEAWARCAVPKASLTNTSPNAASCVANAGSFASSPGSKRTFSSMPTSPSRSEATMLCALSPTTSEARRTSAPSRLLRRAAMGPRRALSSILPVGAPEVRDHDHARVPAIGAPRWSESPRGSGGRRRWRRRASAR